MKKAYLGLVTLLMLSCMACVTALASGHMFSGSLVQAASAVSDFDVDDFGRRVRWMVDVYEEMSIDIVWDSECPERLRPGTGELCDFYIDRNGVRLTPLYRIGREWYSVYMYDLVTGEIYPDVKGETPDKGPRYYRGYIEPDGSAVCFLWGFYTDVYISNETDLYDFVDWYHDLVISDSVVGKSWDDINDALKSAYGAGSYVNGYSDYSVEFGDIMGWHCKSSTRTYDKLTLQRIDGSGHPVTRYEFEVEYTVAPYVLFEDGVPDEEIFPDQKIDVNDSGDYLYLHDNTPQFTSPTRSTEPYREGYNFVGWRLTTGPDKDIDAPGGIRETVEASQMDDHAPFVVYEAVWEEIVEGSPKLSITKTADKSTVAPGDDVTYTVTVSNIGDAVANNVTVSDILDSSLVFKSYQIGSEAVVTSQPSDSVYRLGDIEPGDSVVLYIAVRIADGTPNGSIKNTAVATRAT